MPNLHSGLVSTKPVFVTCCLWYRAEQFCKLHAILLDASPSYTVEICNCFWMQIFYLRVLKLPIYHLQSGTQLNLNLFVLRDLLPPFSPPKLSGSKRSIYARATVIKYSSTSVYTKPLRAWLFFHQDTHPCNDYFQSSCYSKTHF